LKYLIHSYLRYIIQNETLNSKCSSLRHKQVGPPTQSFRATGITNFLENDGTLGAAQRIAGHAHSRTTKLYDRRGQKVLLEDMESIRVLGNRQ
jgi:hypothetical protein